MSSTPESRFTNPKFLRLGKPVPKRRPIWFHLHFWMSWIAAIPVVLVCFTGGVLAFEQYMREWEYPEQFRLEPAGEAMSIDAVMEHYANATPQVVVHHLGIPQSPNHAYGAYATIIEEDGTRRNGFVTVNPYSGELTYRADKFSITGLMVDIHRHLAGGKAGQQIVGISSLLLAVTSLVGLVLWWPMRGRTFSRAWNRGKALDWHNAIGLVALVPLFIMAITGISFTWGKQVFPVLEKLQGSTSEGPAVPVVEVPSGQDKLPLSIPLANLMINFPDGRVTGVQPNGPASRPYVFFVDSNGLNYRVCMDPYTGLELSRFDGKRPGPVGWYRSHFGKLHTMSYNPVTRTAWGALSLMGSVLALTGIWVSILRWRRRRRT